MNTWSEKPLVRLLLPFLAGIISAVYYPIVNNVLLIIDAIVIIAILLITLIPKLNFTYKNLWLFGLLVNLALFLSAYQLTIYKTEKFSVNHYSKYIANTNIFHVRLNETYLEKEKSLKVIVEILGVKQNNKWQNTSGKAMLYLKKDERSLKLNYGDELIVKANFKEIPPPQNPGEFNYKRFLAFHNVEYYAYINGNDWCHTGNNSGNVLLSYSINFRNRLLNVLSKNEVKGDSYAVGSALLLGYEDKLDADIIAAYSSTGALHVLSVSGLHVAIIYLVLNYLLSFFEKIKYGNIIKAILLILFLWFYATLTGLSPSVLRSAAMLSFIITAKSFSRYTNVYNTLAASAFFLLVINPYIIMEVGFQLSYLAVIGIVYIQPKIYNWIHLNNWLLDQIWTILSVSIAAQIATFPLGLHYFHQFPNYFLFSNLVVIPVSTLIIYIGIAVFTFAKFSIIVVYLAKGFDWSVWVLNSSVRFIERLPYSLIQGISISVFETWLIYGLIILFLYYFTKRKFKYLFLALLVMVIFACSLVIEQFQEFNQRKLIIYNIPKTSAIDFISAKSNVMLTDTTFAKNESRLLFHVKHNWWDLGSTDSKIITSNYNSKILSVQNNFIQFYNKRIVIVNKQMANAIRKFEANPISIDYLIVSGNPYIEIETILKQFNPKIIVFDSSNNELQVNKWVEQCSDLNKKYFAVCKSGALLEEIVPN